MIPILFLLIFLLVVLKISTRSSLKGLDQSLNNINSINILGKINNLIMIIKEKNINKFFIFFIFLHTFVWTLIPSSSLILIYH